MSGLRIINTIGLVAGITGLGYGLYTYYKKQISIASQYCYKVAQIKPLNFTINSIKFELIFKILNRSLFGLTIKSYDLDVFLDGNFITTIKSENENVIHPSSSSFISAVVDINPSKILQSKVILSIASKYLYNKSNIIIQVKGSFKIKGGLIGNNIVVNYTDNLQSLIDSSKESDSKMICPKDF